MSKPKRKPKLKSADIRNIIVFSDTHIGCKLALVHPDGAELDEGGLYKPSPIQLKLWEHFDYFWNVWVPKVTHGEPYYVVHNGDAIDGVHHNSTTQWSHNLKDQRRHAEKIIKPIVDGCRGNYYHIRGTETHVGKSGADEEDLARDLGAIPNETGNHARWDLWKELTSGKQKFLCNFSHHIGTTNSTAHETSAVNAELASAFSEAGQWGHAMPSVVFRSHRHRHSEVRLPASWGYAICAVTPAWQLKTPYVYRLKQGRTGEPQIGGSLIRVGSDELHTRHFVVGMGRGRIE